MKRDGFNCHRYRQVKSINGFRKGLFFTKSPV